MSHKDALFNIFNYTKYLVIDYLGLSQKFDHPNDNIIRDHIKRLSLLTVVKYNNTYFKTQ
jgi:hypothetical protein